VLYMRSRAFGGCEGRKTLQQGVITADKLVV
jgi:hypothetical protein